MHIQIPCAIAGKLITKCWSSLKVPPRRDITAASAHAQRYVEPSFNTFPATRNDRFSQGKLIIPHISTYFVIFPTILWTKKLRKISLLLWRVLLLRIWPTKNPVTMGLPTHLVNPRSLIERGDAILMTPIAISPIVTTAAAPVRSPVVTIAVMQEMRRLGSTISRLRPQVCVVQSVFLLQPLQPRASLLPMCSTNRWPHCVIRLAVGVNRRCDFYMIDFI